MAFVDVEFEEEEDAGLDRRQVQHFSEAVLHSADWTVETIVSQLTRSNIEMNPRFQRRDAWSRSRKSTFIESLILGLPVPQIVLAEKQGQRESISSWMESRDSYHFFNSPGMLREKTIISA